MLSGRIIIGISFVHLDPKIPIMVLPGAILSFQVLNRVLCLWQPEAPKKVLWSTFFLRVHPLEVKRKRQPWALIQRHKTRTFCFGKNLIHLEWPLYKFDKTKWHWATINGCDFLSGDLSLKSAGQSWENIVETAVVKYIHGIHNIHDTSRSIMFTLNRLIFWY